MTNKKNSARAYNAGFIGDNLARRAQAAQPAYAPKREPYKTPERKPEHREKPNGQSRKQPEKERGLRASLGFAFTVLIAASVGIIFFVLVKYISLNIDSTQKARQVEKLSRELSAAVMENDNYEMAINTSIDYDYIFKVATEELGMVYPSQKQIITYKSKKSEYVEQYKDLD